MKKSKLIIIILISVVLVITFNVIMTIKKYDEYQSKTNEVLANILGEISEKYPKVKEEELIEILNRKKDSTKIGEDILEKYGINIEETSVICGIEEYKKSTILINIISIMILCTIIVCILFTNSKIRKRKIQNIIKYIEEINKKNYNLQIEKNSEDELSNLSKRTSRDFFKR